MSREEEYKILKRLEGEWKWIARDNDTNLWVYKKEPNKHYWVNVWSDGSGGEHLPEELFRFIQWSDSEPHNIAKLIKGYESEETKVKDIKWFKEKFYKSVDRIEKAAMEGGGVFKYIHIDYIKNLIDQLDEPESLSQEWIDEHTWNNHSIRRPFVYVDDLQNIVVPNQEITEEQAYNKIAESFPASAKEIVLVLEKYYSGMLTGFSEELRESIVRAFDVEATSKTIEVLTGMTLEQIAEEARDGEIVLKKEQPIVPKYVADWISRHSGRFDLFPALKRLENNALSWDDVYEWYRGNTSKFVNAYLTGEYETEEQKYVIKLDDEVYLQRYEIDNKNIVTPFRIVGYLKEAAIKFNDKKRAEKVAELVEGKIEKVEDK